MSAFEPNLEQGIYYMLRKFVFCVSLERLVEGGKMNNKGNRKPVAVLVKTHQHVDLPLVNMLTKRLSGCLFVSSTVYEDTLKVNYVKIIALFNEVSSEVQSKIKLDFQIKSHSLEFAKLVSIFSNIIFSCWLRYSDVLCNVLLL